MLNNSVIIVTGDCGFGFNKKEYYHQILTNLNNLLLEINSHIFFIRGNHDDPSYFNNKVFDFSNINIIQDYSVIITANENILCVGGAISSDRSWRITKEQHINRFAKSNPKKLYWSDEKPIFDEEKLSEIMNSALDIDFVVTHSAPSFACPSSNNDAEAWEETDSNLLDDIAKEHKVFDDIYDYLIKNDMPIKGWFYGHYHMNYSTKSKESIPFLCIPNNFSFTDIYSITDDAIELKMKYTINNGLLGNNPYVQPRRLDEIRAERREIRMPHFVEDHAEGNHAEEDVNVAVRVADDDFVDGLDWEVITDYNNVRDEANG